VHVLAESVDVNEELTEAVIQEEALCERLCVPEGEWLLDEVVQPEEVAL
jgi:hypothetical protein